MRPFRYLYPHNLFDSLYIGKTVDKTADSADPFSDESVFCKFPFLDELFEPAMHVTDGREDIDNRFILKHKVKMDWFGEYRVLGPERYDYLF
jgi:hypothetical protein